MSNSSMPNIPGMGAMTDTLDFVKNLWGGMSIPGMGIPGMVMPTLSVEEINKQISDLKTVESWLTLNMNMLRSTIQALEVQSATIATLKSMSETLSAAVKPSPARSAASEAPPAPKEEPKAAAPEAEAPPEPLKAAAAAGSTAGAGTDAQLGNPAVWWNMLQDQFKQAVNTAMASEKPAKPEPSVVPAKTPVANVEAEAKPKKPAAPRAKKAPKAAEK
ncbi:MAG: hypothetical protein P4L91_08880 [Burkholderiaceae bacterium]|nr:hypothetical protein [Burkholderiaceae bacterium]